MENNNIICGITPENILRLKADEIFIYGSNLAGRHGAGAARLAMEKFGAIYGIGEGLQGNSYALPTKDKFISTLPLSEIEKHIDTLYDCILKHPHKHFLITKIGCGLANLNIFQVAPMFKKFISLSNCSLPKEFIEINSK